MTIELALIFIVCMIGIWSLSPKRPGPPDVPLLGVPESEWPKLVKLRDTLLEELRNPTKGIPTPERNARILLQGLAQLYIEAYNAGRRKRFKPHL